MWPCEHFYIIINIQGSKEAFVEWLNPAGLLLSTKESLVLTNLSWQHMGLYTCRFTTELGAGTKTTFVYPLAPEK